MQLCWCHYFQPGWLDYLLAAKLKRSKNDCPELFETYFSWIDSISELLCSNDDIYDVDDIKKKNYENGYYEYIIKT